MVCVQSQLARPQGINWVFGDYSKKRGIEVQFRLVYRGPLASNGDARQKHEIRKQFHPQLAELWRVDPHLSRWLDIGTVQAGLDVPQSLVGHRTPSMASKIADNYHIGNFRFVPLVSEEFGTACSMDILFLRREFAGKIISGGDIDNRLKTLFDALRTPRKVDEAGGQEPTDSEKPYFFTLLADDSLITDFRVEADRLLSPQGPLEHPHHVMLVINAKTKIVDYKTAYIDMNFQ